MIFAFAASRQFLSSLSGAHPGMLDVRSVSRHFGGLKAVDAVSMAVRRGEIVGLIGPNGAGKTTLFNLVAGTIKPSAGEILLGGRQIGGGPPHRRLAHGLGRTFQIPRPFPNMTLIENLLVAARGQTGERILANWFRPRVVAKEEHRNLDRAYGLLDFVTLANLAHEPARILSGGQRKLLELARVMMAEPALVLLDEPAAGVNPSLVETIISRIAELNRQGVTFLVIEHDMDLVARLCAHVFVMAGGRNLAEGTPAEVVRNRHVIEAYLGGGG
jgi:branched-chain amino acid transport system ATP-binding protein